MHKMNTEHTNLHRNLSVNCNFTLLFMSTKFYPMKSFITYTLSITVSTTSM